jgi:nucleoside-diphosphate-sugar epimerase
VSEGFTLVTGAAGFIGARLTETLVSQGKRVIALDTFLDVLYPAKVKMNRWKKLESLDSKLLHMLKFDLRKDNFQALDEFEVTSIINQAALPGLSDNPKIYSLYYECNIAALNRLLEFARSRPINKFVQASTSSVYGKFATGDENAELNPVSPYGVSKLAAEKLLKAYKENFNIPTVILRYFSVYGPGQRPDMAYSKLIKAAITGEKFHLFGDGQQRRSNTYIDDIVSATIKAVTEAEGGETFNVCGDESISLLEAIQVIESGLGLKIQIQRYGKRDGDQIETSGLNHRIKSKLNWEAKTDFRIGLQNQISYSIEETTKN